ncbi:Glycine--tRNA ligase beta subunit, partial [Clarias magur]
MSTAAGSAEPLLLLTLPAARLHADSETLPLQKGHAAAEASANQHMLHSTLRQDW